VLDASPAVSRPNHSRMTMVSLAGKSTVIESAGRFGMSPGARRAAQDFALPFSTAGLKLVSKPAAASKGFCSIPALA
jgi:hypothetical protein